MARNVVLDKSDQAPDDTNSVDHTADPLLRQTGLTAEQRKLRAQIAAAALYVNGADGKAQTDAARKAFQSRFADEIDPSGDLRQEVADAYARGNDDLARKLEDDLHRRIKHAKTAHYSRLALASSKARARRRVPAGEGTA